MKWLKEKAATILMKYLGGGLVEKALSFLPANGQKTLTALVLTILLTGGALAGGTTPEWLVVIVEMVKSTGVKPLGDPISLAADVSAFLAAVFAFHKTLKGLKQVYDDAASLEAKDKGYVEGVKNQGTVTELPRAKGH